LRSIGASYEYKKRGKRADLGGRKWPGIRTGLHSTGIRRRKRGGGELEKKSTRNAKMRNNQGKGKSIHQSGYINIRAIRAKTKKREP